MNPKYEFLKQYAIAKLDETYLEEQLNSILQRINPDNYLVGMQSPKSAQLLDDLMAHIAGPDLLDWVHWWIWEADHGSKHFDFSVGGREYTVSELTFEQFLEIVDASN